jgi:hypothetical protein
MYHGLIAAAGPNQRLPSRREKRGEPILSILSVNSRPHGVCRRLTDADSPCDLT